MYVIVTRELPVCTNHGYDEPLKIREAECFALGKMKRGGRIFSCNLKTKDKITIRKETLSTLRTNEVVNSIEGRKKQLMYQKLFMRLKSFSLPSICFDYFCLYLILQFLLD